MPAPDSPPDPRGSTLWEMFLQWMKNRGSSEPVAASSLLNPLDWVPGSPVSRDATHGPEFASSLTRVEELRQVVRRVSGQEFPFVDYVLRVSPRDAAPFRMRLRCLPDGQGGWQRLLLRLHDEFGFAADFVELLNDPSGVFTIQDDPPEIPPVAGSGTGFLPPPIPAEVSFQRLNDVTGPWNATVIRQLEGVAAPDGSSPGASSSGQTASGSMEYWDYLHVGDDGAEEFLFVEIDGTNGWIQIWRGSRILL